MHGTAPARVVHSAVLARVMCGAVRHGMVLARVVCGTARTCVVCGVVLACVVHGVVLACVMYGMVPVCVVCGAALACVAHVMRSGAQGCRPSCAVKKENKQRIASLVACPCRIEAEGGKWRGTEPQQT